MTVVGILYLIYFFSMVKMLCTRVDHSTNCTWNSIWSLKYRFVIREIITVNCHLLRLFSSLRAFVGSTRLCTSLVQFRLIRGYLEHKVSNITLYKSQS